MRIRTFLAQVLTALVLSVLFGTAAAQASPITINKSFTPNVVNLGGSSLVTITLQNNDTTSAATITGLTDDIGTTMAGTAVVDYGSGVATTCSGGTPAISANGATAATITSAGFTSAFAPFTNPPSPDEFFGIPAAFITRSTRAPRHSSNPTTNAARTDTPARGTRRRM